MDIEKLIEQLRTESLYADKASLEIMDLCMDAATALSTLQDENERLRNEAEGMRSNWYKSVDEIKKLRAELEQAKREGRCVVLDDLTMADLQQMLTVLDSTRYGDGVETYTTGYRNGHRNGRIEILRHVLGINEGDSAETELRREQDGE